MGYDQADTLSEQDTRVDIESYGKVINEVLDNLPASLPHLRKIAKKCEDPDSSYRTVADLQLAMERRSSSQLYVFLCVFIAVMAALLMWLSFV